MDENLPDTNVEKIEYIRKKDAFDAIKNANGILYWNNTLQNSLTQLIEDLSSADVVPVVHAHWIDGYRWQTCSKCRNKGKRSWKFCPNCGAKMRGRGVNNG